MWQIRKNDEVDKKTPVSADAANDARTETLDYINLKVELRR